jgi:nucleotide-binding universal stress UspA family protein
MMTKTNILIALDGSAWSRQVLAPVRQLLAPADYEIVLLRVGQLPAGKVGAPPRLISTTWMSSMYENRRDLENSLHPIYDSQQEANERAALEVALLPDQQLLQRDGYCVTSLVRFGDPAEEIIELARNANFDMVAMATHGQSGLRRMVMGSVTEKVLHELKIPVLLVRPTDRVAQPAPAWLAKRSPTVIVPLDGSPTAEQGIYYATELMPIAGARLVLVGVEPAVGNLAMAEVGVIPYWAQADHEDAVLRLNRYLKQTATRLANNGLVVETRLAEGNPAEEILRISADEHADLIVMATHGRTGMGRLLRGSVAAKVLGQADAPVLLARIFEDHGRLARS